jgi:uncharacterized membrane protein
MKIPRIGRLSNQTLFLLLMLAAACALRIWHLDRWLPQYYEEATPVLKANGFWGGANGPFDFNPHFFNYPALSFYIHFAFQATWLLLSALSGQIASLAEFRHMLGTDLHRFVFLGRGVTLLFDLSTMVLVYLLGKRLGGERIGIIAALLLACNNLHVRLSQYVMVDVPLTFFIVLALSILWTLFVSHL